MADADTPFHEGELAVQDMVGVRERVHSYAPRVIRPFMPDQHRIFFQDLPYIFVGAADEEGRPWATVWFGKPGFVFSPDPRTLEIADVRQEGDPVSACLEVGGDVGFLGLALHDRRRNRVNGRTVPGEAGKLTVSVTQSFGNCPKYIQRRDVEPEDGQASVIAPAQSRGSFTSEDLGLIEECDTFFIATVAAKAGENISRGVDVSHRGGAPGFVKGLSADYLIFPDFAGNNYFNTLGNIHETGKAGLLFIDFKSGDILQVTGRAELLWPQSCDWSYEGAERYVRFTVEHVVRRNGAVSVGWQFIDASPFTPVGSEWRQATCPDKM